MSAAVGRGARIDIHAADRILRDCRWVCRTIHPSRFDLSLELDSLASYADSDRGMKLTHLSVAARFVTEDKRH